MPSVQTESQGSVLHLYWMSHNEYVGARKVWRV